MIDWISKIMREIRRGLFGGKAERTSTPMTRRGILAGGILALAVLAVGGLLIMVSGVIPMRASSGHWPITRGFLHFTKERSISTYSMGTSVPPLEDPDLILRGGTHYETGCRSCHGHPGMKHPRISQRMLPAPPYLPDVIGKREPAELFQVVKHGLKFTGMPAWPVPDRDDEVWAVVAFLRKMPELDEEAYLQLVLGDTRATTSIVMPDGLPQIPDIVTRSCARCHGRDGIARGNSAFPHLAGQRIGYLKNSLKAYASGERHSGIMGPVAAELSDETIDELVRYYAGLAPPRQVPADPAHTDAIRRGEAIATRGSLDDRLPSCADCHASNGGRFNEAYPSLEGQPAAFLVLQLELFKGKNRGGTSFSHLMHPTADRLDEQQMRDLSLYFQSLPRR